MFMGFGNMPFVIIFWPLEKNFSNVHPAEINHVIVIESEFFSTIISQFKKELVMIVS